MPGRAEQTALPPWFDEYDRPLGKPKGQAVLGEDGVLRREFASGTIASYDTKARIGRVKWASDDTATAVEPGDEGFPGLAGGGGGSVHN